MPVQYRENNVPAYAYEPRIPGIPPVTAKTSPYDYLTTVIYHPEQTEEIDGKREQIWSVNCAVPECYGVPLFRQYLTGVDDGSVSKDTTREWAKWYQTIMKDGKKVKGDCSQEPNTVGCRWPFIRMSGTATATRETMTVNGGMYYIDTTIPREMQRDEDFNRQGGNKSLTTFFNVFMPGQTYTVFFLYLKHDTFQKYQIYVGKDFANDAFKAVQVQIPNAAFKIEPIAHPDWLKVDTSAVKTTGILTVTLNLSLTDPDLVRPSAANGLCKPLDFCKSVGRGCEGNVSEGDRRFLALNGDEHYGQREATDICAEWAQKDLDCPPTGCLGFQFTLPSTFTADATVNAPSPHRPKPEIFPARYDNGAQPAEFSRTLRAPDDKEGGTCYYPQVPKGSKPITTEQCLVP
jgi:cell migration-inducing and hyaluronan-binding protein